MEETLKIILEKLGQLDTMQRQLDTMQGNFDTIQGNLDTLQQKVDKIDLDVNALKNDNKITHQKLNVITNEVANIKEQITDHDIKIQVISNSKTKAI